MSGFTDITDWAERQEGYHYALTKPLPWEVGHVGSGFWVTVPAGFRFDLSAPFGRRNPKYLKAAALHDWALAKGWRRVSAAALFEDALHADGVGAGMRLVMTLAVIVWRFK